MAWLRRTVTSCRRLGLAPYQPVAPFATANATTEGERKIASLLTEKLKPTYLEVRDVSGGCGAMYEIAIDSEQFSGKRLVQQHRMVTEALGPVVKTLHGLTIKTGNPIK
ncbi:hypothetical protein EMCRGX_G030996 [Ephydatia muelleri]